MEDPKAIVTGSLERLSEAIRAKDLEATASLFEPEQPILVGSDPGEIMIGRAAVVEQLRRVVEAPTPLSFEWSEPVVRCNGDIVCFFVEGTYTMTGPARPYLLSGVLVRESTDWRLAMFHGSEPK